MSVSWNAGAFSGDGSVADSTISWLAAIVVAASVLEHRGTTAYATLAIAAGPASGSGTSLADLDPAAQDKQANDLMDMFDWNQTPLPPLVLQPRSSCPL